MPLVRYGQLLGKGSQEEKDEKGEAVLSNLVGLSGYYFEGASLIICFSRADFPSK
jgi:hypothetical protein